MSEATNTKLMDVERGGEQTQYEGAKVFKDQVPPPSEGDKERSSQFDDATGKSEADTQAAKEKRERGEKTAENIRYGEAISEHGFGGETLGNSGGVEAGDREEGNDARKVAGYKEEGSGKGDEIGA